MKQLFTLCLTVMTVLVAFGQLQNHYWFFGNSATGVYFDPVTNQPQQNNVQYTPYGGEGCGVVTNPLTGNLLFYSDGERVLNSTHNVMQNGAGLGGCSSSAQAVAMAQVPGECNTYYIFSNTRGSGCTTQEIRYSIIDMNANGGLGTIPLATKNQLLRNNIGEGMIIIPKPAGDEFWLVGKDGAGATYYVYEITAGGINFVNTYTVGSCGFIYNMHYSATAGKIAFACPSGSFFYADFNANTGAISNYQFGGNVPSAYDVEFSPDGTKLYCSGWTNLNLYQLDLNTGNMTALMVNNGTLGGGLRTGPDGKIYHIWDRNQNFLATINNPNAAGAACNYVTNGFNAGGPASGLNLPEVLAATSVNILLEVDSASATNVSCNGGSDGTAAISITSNDPPYNILWSNNGNTPAINNLSAGLYSVTVSDDAGCTDSLDITITEPTAISLNLDSTTDVSCNGGNDGSADVTISGGTPPYSIENCNGQTVADFTGLSAGCCLFTIYDDNGCSDTLTICIDEPTALNPSTTVTDVSCNGGTDGSIDLTVNGATTPYTFNWSNGAATEDLNNLSAGTYSVTIYDANQCADSVVNINVNEPTALNFPLFSTVVNDVECFGDSTGAIDIEVNGGTPPYTYSWSNGDTNQDISNLAADIYQVTITDDNGCTLGDTLTVDQPPAPLQANANITDVTCNGGSDGEIDITVAGGTNPYSFNWSHGPQTVDVQNLSTGNYGFTLTDDNNCTYIDTYYVDEANAIQLSSTTSDALCFGSSDGTIDVSIQNGTPPYTYNWDNGPATQDNLNIGAGTYTLNVSDDNGCTATLTDTINEPAELSLSITGTDALCFGSSDGTLTTTAQGGTPGYSYQWPGNQNTATANGLSMGTYTVTVTDTHGCLDTISGVVDQPTELSLSLVTDSASCYEGNDGRATATATGGTGGYTYNWSDGSANGNVASNLTAGNYDVTVEDANGCQLTEPFTIEEPPAMVLDAGDDYLVAIGDPDTVELNYQVNGQNPAFIWSPAEGLSCTTCPQPELAPITSTEYTVTLTDGPCALTDVIWVEVDPEPRIFYVPNAFTPNNDGHNDVFHVYAKGVSTINFKVFNRWGELLFHTTDPDAGWDGNYQGKAQPPGVYIYVAEIEYLDGHIDRKKGSVTLLK